MDSSMWRYAIDRVGRPRAMTRQTISNRASDIIASLLGLDRPWLVAHPASAQAEQSRRGWPVRRGKRVVGYPGCAWAGPLGTASTFRAADSQMRSRTFHRESQTHSGGKTALGAATAPDSDLEMLPDRMILGQSPVREVRLLRPETRLTGFLQAPACAPSALSSPRRQVGETCQDSVLSTRICLRRR